MPADKHELYDLVVIGSGPGGYVAAIRAAQLGKKVACVERHSSLGGTCLNIGCIPSKALLESSQTYQECKIGLDAHGIKIDRVSLDLATMMTRKENIVKTLTRGIEFLFKKNKIDRFIGTASLLEGPVVRVAGEQVRELSAKAVILATGSKVTTPPGIKIDGTDVVSSTEALSFATVPEKLAVIGSGAVGLELGSVWHRLGAEVTVMEYFDRVLPSADRDISKEILRLFKKQGMQFKLGTRIESIERNEGKCRLIIDGQDPFTVDKVLVATGRSPCTENLGFLELGGKTDNQGYIEVDENWQTSLASVYAIGDVIGGAMLAHKASEEGVACVERLYTGYGHVNYQVVPNIVYTHPEIASVGQSEQTLSEQGVPINIGTFYFKANGRALALGDSDGWIKVIAHRDTDRLLGVHIIGPRAGDLLAEAVVAMEYGASSEDLGRAFHAHPTLAEALKEAALKVDNRAIHG